MTPNHLPPWLDQLRQDLTYALHTLRRSPAFTLTAIAAIALGIGASTAVFSFTDRILFRPLPYANESELVWFGMSAPIAESEFLLTWDYGMWRAKQSAFSAMASSSGAGDCELAANEPLRLRCASVEPGFLPLFGLTPQIGRDFTPEDDQPGAPPTALISHNLWRTRFAANPAILNQTIDLDGRPVRVNGVLPPNFELPTLAEVDILRPFQRDPRERGAAFLHVFARLKPGVSLAEAKTRLYPLFLESLKSVPPAFIKDIHFLVHPLRERQTRDTSRAAQLLLLAVALVFLIALANVANLQIARAATRQHEHAIRAALGASLGRLLRQSLTESLLLCSLGAAAGLALAAALLRLILATAPAGIARLEPASLDGRVLCATIILTLIATLAVGLAPAFQPPHPELLTGGRVIGRRRQFLRPALVIVQIALSMVLLCGASLLLHSLWKLSNVALGIQTESLLTVQAQLPRLRYPEKTQQLAFWETVEQRLSRLPGVSRSALSNSVPPNGQAMATIYASMEVDGRGRLAADGVGGMVVIRQVTPSYFNTLQIPIKSGRAFAENDRNQPDSKVILDETLAARAFPNENPIGRKIKSGDTGWMEIVGVAANVRNAGLDRKPDPEFYMVKRHNPADARLQNTAILLATPALAPAIRAEFQQLDPRLTVQIETLESRVSKLQSKPRFQTLLLSAFAAIGLLLSAIGLYGVVALLISQRAEEFAIRQALGATPADIEKLILRQATNWLTAGLGLGLLIAMASAKAIESLLFNTPPTAALPIAAAALTLTATTYLAARLPARLH